MLDSLADLDDLATRTPDVYVRYSEGWEADARHGSSDTESGLGLPRLSVIPLIPEPWWTHRVEVGRGPDCDPLLAKVRPAALLSANLLTEAEGCYRWNFDAGKGPEDSQGGTYRSMCRHVQARSGQQPGIEKNAVRRLRSSMERARACRIPCLWFGALCIINLSMGRRRVRRPRVVSPDPGNTSSVGNFSEFRGSGS